MRKLLLLSTPLLALAVASSPAFSQGVSMSPPAPNANNSMPQPPNSYPPGARTLSPGTTGIQREGTVATTHYGTRHHSRHYRRARAVQRRPVNPDMPEGQTVPTPQSQ